MVNGCTGKAKPIVHYWSRRSLEHGGIFYGPLLLLLSKKGKRSSSNVLGKYIQFSLEVSHALTDRLYKRQAQRAGKPMELAVQREVSTRLVGAGYVAVSACSFAAMAIFAKTAYSSGAETFGLLALRFDFAALLMTGVMLLKRQRWPRGHNLLYLIGMGSIGYVGQSFCFFSALKYASAGLVALLLYLHPAIVAVLACLFFGYRLSGLKLLAIIGALAGTAIIVSGDSCGSATGILLGMGAAFIYSGYILVGTRVLQTETPIAAATVIMLAAAAVFTSLALWFKPALPATISGWLAAAGIALISTVVAMITFFAGLSRLAPGDAATISTLEPLVTVLLAAIFLGEPLTVVKAVGGVVIVGSLILLARLA
jgi:drug/metabolite transporter (DMT)-like permease